MGLVRLAILVLIGASFLPVGCKRSEDLNGSRQMPRLAPPPDAGVVSDVTVTVEVDGRAAPSLDRAKLDATPPDFTDGDRRAWRVETLLGLPAADDSLTFTVTGDHDVAIVLHHASTDPDLLPILAVNRRGQMLAAMVEKSDPFPSYHGQGRRLERRGDPLPRVEGVKHVAVTRAASP